VVDIEANTIAVVGPALSGTNILERNGKIILEYGKHLQECTGNLA
ncbi:unnamed protein product, partial [Porites evermanni]